MDADIRVVNEKIQKESMFVQQLMSEIGKVIVGQSAMVERLLIARFWQTGMS